MASTGIGTGIGIGLSRAAANLRRKQDIELQDKESQTEALYGQAHDIISNLGNQQYSVTRDPSGKHVLTYKGQPAQNAPSDIQNAFDQYVSTSKKLQDLWTDNPSGLWNSFRQFMGKAPNQPKLTPRGESYSPEAMAARVPAPQDKGLEAVKTAQQEYLASGADPAGFGAWYQRRLGITEKPQQPQQPTYEEQTAIDAKKAELGRDLTPQEANAIINPPKEAKTPTSELALWQQDPEAFKAYMAARQETKPEPKAPPLVGELRERVDIENILADSKSTSAQKTAAQARKRELESKAAKESRAEAESQTPDFVLTEKPTGPKANQPIMAIGLTPNAIWQGSAEYALTNHMPSFGFGSTGQVRAARFAIENTASARADAAGVDIPTLQAEYRANAGALSNSTKLYTQTKINEDSALGYFSLLKQLGQRRDAQSIQSSIPILNRWIQSGQLETTNNPALNNYLSVLTNSLTEYAKVIAGQTGGAGVTVEANRQAQNLVNHGLSTATINDWIDNAATPEMAKRTGAYLNNIAATSNTIASFLAGRPVQAGGGGTNRIRVRNKQTGQTGTISEGAFDPAKYDRIQ